MKKWTAISLLLLTLLACDGKPTYSTFDTALPFGGNKGDIISIEEATYRLEQEGDSLIEKTEAETVEDFFYNKNGLMESRTYIFMEQTSVEKFFYDKEQKLIKETTQIGTSAESAVLETIYTYIDSENAYSVTTSSIDSSKRDSTHLFYHAPTQSITAIGKDAAGASSATVLYYDNRRVIERDYKSDRGKSRNTKVFYDDVGLKSHETIMDSQGTRAIVTYEYSEFDVHENWTRRESYLGEQKNSVVERKIIYRQ